MVAEWNRAEAACVDEQASLKQLKWFESIWLIMIMIYDNDNNENNHINKNDNNMMIMMI